MLWARVLSSCRFQKAESSGPGSSEHSKKHPKDHLQPEARHRESIRNQVRHSCSLRWEVERPRRITLVRIPAACHRGLPTIGRKHGRGEQGPLLGIPSSIAIRRVSRITRIPSLRVTSLRVTSLRIPGLWIWIPGLWVTSLWISGLWIWIPRLRIRRSGVKRRDCRGSGRISRVSRIRIPTWSRW